MKLQIADLELSYDTRSILKGLGFSIEPGELVALIGPNGSGKTTLLRSLSGLHKPSNGNIYLDSQNIQAMQPAEVAVCLAALEQEIHASTEITVREAVSLGRLPHQKRWSSNSLRDQEIVEQAMQETNVSQFADRSVNALSSGERQRVWLAMALAQEPQILLLDEPTSHLDIKYQIETMEILKRLANNGLTVVVSLHDLNLAAHYSNKVALLANRKLLAFGSPVEVLTESLIGQAYGINVDLIYTNTGDYIFVPKLNGPGLSDAA